MCVKISCPPYWNMASQLNNSSLNLSKFWLLWPKVKRTVIMSRPNQKEFVHNNCANNLIKDAFIKCKWGTSKRLQKSTRPIARKCQISLVFGKRNWSITIMKQWGWNSNFKHDKQLNWISKEKSFKNCILIKWSNPLSVWISGKWKSIWSSRKSTTFY